MSQSTAQTLLKAKSLLGLPQTCSLYEIKTRYRKLMQKWHPDKNPNSLDEAHEMSAMIIEAYKTIIEYTNSYHYDFTEEYVNNRKSSPAEWWENQFGDPNRTS